MSELAYRPMGPAGAADRAVTPDGAWSVPAMQAVMTAPAAQALTAPAAPGQTPPGQTAPASPGQTPPGQIAPAQTTPASATTATVALVSGIRAIPSITHPNEPGHLRAAVKVPVTLSLQGLGDLASSVSVQLTMSPVAPVASVLQVRGLAPVTRDLSLTFASIGKGGASVSTTHNLRSGSFTADLLYTATAGVTQVDFAIDGYGYHGGNHGHRDFSVTAVVTFQEHGKQAPTVLASNSLISL